ncbi:hypothetical protein F0562_018960 [Nyssa sinensis]|uniref:non-specific serine/threonine protein kinase n=1 Tax=Nyssa sinensis TaxID=561372 RepID=A0A5J4ZC19_9ASTE|nr:hypothetical protein F0562_018960 [Nyssa sinensis]
MYHEIKLLSSSFVLFLLFQFSTSTDTITSNQSIKDGDIVISNAKSFALGFFSPDNSTKRYVGIWYYKVSEQTVVWVANRDSPINDTSGILSIDRTGNLVIHDRRQNNIPLWSTNASALSAAAAAANNCSAQLLDSGNLVLFPGDSKRVVAWQSFDYPTNTMLPDMKLGADRRTGLNWFLTSWKSREDPGTGEYSYKMDLSGLPEFFLYKGSDPVWRTGPWNGLRWSGVPAMNPNSIFNVIYVDNDDEVSVIYGIHNASIFSRLMVNETGIVGRLTWHDGGRGWVGFWSSPKDTCDEYNGCGAYGDCDPRNASDFKCTCLPGFEPKSARDWYMRDGSGGCVRKRGRQVCGSGDGFVKVTNAKLPDTLTARADQKLGIKACKELCLSNCSCTAYTNADIRGEGSGCMIWYGELVDTREYTNGGQDLYPNIRSQKRVIKIGGWWQLLQRLSL